MDREKGMNEGDRGRNFVRQKRRTKLRPLSAFKIDLSTPQTSQKWTYTHTYQHYTQVSTHKTTVLWVEIFQEYCKIL